MRTLKVLGPGAAWAAGIGRKTVARLVVTLLLLSLPPAVFAQGDDTGVAVDGAGNVYVVGWTEKNLFGPRVGYSDAYVCKYDAARRALWARQFGLASTRVEALGVAVDGAGNVYVVGYTGGALPGQTLAGLDDAYVRKYDGAGSVLWTRQFGLNLLDFAYGVAVDGAGNVYVVGHRGVGRTDEGFLHKYDGAGNVLWTRLLGTWVFARGVAVDGAGNVYVVGYTYEALPGQTSSGGRDAFVRKYDGAGNELWTRQFGTGDYNEARGVAVDGAGDVCVVGETRGALPGQTRASLMDAYVRKYDGAGNELWTRQFGTVDTGSAYGAYGVAVDGAGNVYVVGGTTVLLAGRTTSGAYVRKYAPAGSELWTRLLHTSDWAVARGVAVDGAGNVYVVGSTGWGGFLLWRD